MKKKLILALFIASISFAFANCYANWQGSTIEFTIINNTSQQLGFGPAWNQSADTMPEFQFPQGKYIAPHSTYSYFISPAKRIEVNILGVVSTVVSLSNDNSQSISTICNTHFYVEENTNHSLELTNYMNDGLFVANSMKGYSCTGSPVDFNSGHLQLLVSETK